ncbi:MAG: hypothetical protein RBU37_11585 [Myxococcota bacterium]|jgi:hypothetical protein|nr:hypothetical protein [Myxococcota bacterium]
MRSRLAFVLAVLALFGLVACDDGGSEKQSSSKRVTTVSGQLSAPQGKGDATTQVKAQMVVGPNKVSVPAKINAKAREFAFTDIPAGDKTILIDLGNGPLPVKFPKAQGAQAWAAFLPDLPILASALGDASEFALELGTIELSDDGTYFEVAENFSPFKFFDTNGDGSADWMDDDIDGDGIPNEEDESPFGDEWSDWSWVDEILGDFDEDGDGIPDWGDDDFGGDWFDMDDIGGWDFCELDDEACWSSLCDENDPFCLDDADWCLDFPNDPFCGTTCAVNTDCEAGWTCDDGFCVPVSSSCDADDDCAVGENCVAGACVPASSACEDDGDCMAGEHCHMGACVPDSTVCTMDSDCATGEVCVSGACIPDNIETCSADIDCEADEVCVNGLCIPDSVETCSADIDCEAGEVCMDGMCIPSSMTCTSDFDCETGEVCMDGMCIPDSVTCSADDDCAVGQVCMSGICVIDW